MTIVQLYDLFAVRYRWTFLLVFLAAFAAAAAVTFTLPKEYKAEATLVVGENRPLGEGATSAQSDEVLTRTYASLLETSAVERDVLEAVPFEVDRSALADKVEIEVVAATRLIRITTFDAEPARAQQLADAYATTFVRRQQRSALDASREQVDALLERIGMLSSDLEAAQADPGAAGVQRRARLTAQLDAAREAYRTTQRNSSLEGSNVAVASSATLPSSPAKPRTKLNLALGLFFALVLGAGAVLLRNVFDDRVRDADEVSAIVGAPVLARIPSVRGGAEDAAAREAVDVLRTMLWLREPAPTVIAVVGTERGEGKTTVASLLTSALARAGGRVLAVDCDLRRPALGTRLGADPSARGVTDILVARPVHDAIHLVVPASSPGVSVLPAGPLPPNPSMLLGLPRLREMLHALERSFDAVVVDTAPMSAGADTVAVVAAVEQVVVVVDARTTRRRRLAALREDLERSGAEILGIALNRAPGGTTAYVPDDDAGARGVAPRSRARA